MILYKHTAAGGVLHFYSVKKHSGSEPRAQNTFPVHRKQVTSKREEEWGAGGAVKYD